MPSAAQVRDEVLFWLGQQEREHMLLLAQGTADPSIRADAAKLAVAYQNAALAEDVGALVQLTDASQAVKRAALESARKGWCGFLYGALLEHMIEEIDHLILRIRRNVEPRHTVGFWARERSGAAGVTGRYLDPSESAASAEAHRYQAALRDLHAAAKKPSSGNIAPNVLAFTVPLDRFLLRSQGLQSIAPPMLVEHEIREGLVAEAMLADLARSA